MTDTQKFIKMNGTWYQKYKKNTHTEATVKKAKGVNQKKRADKWALKYKENMGNYNKVMLDNDDLKRVNNELNIMQTRTLDKVLYLGNENKKLKDKIKKLSIK